MDFSNYPVDRHEQLLAQFERERRLWGESWFERLWRNLKQLFMRSPEVVDDWSDVDDAVPINTFEGLSNDPKPNAKPRLRVVQRPIERSPHA